jgi:hypothetical protein
MKIDPSTTYVKVTNLSQGETSSVRGRGYYLPI